MANLAGFLQYSYPLTTDGLEPIDVVANDILASSLQVDGSNSMAATLRMSNNRITEVLDANTDDGAVNRLQMTTADAAISSFANTTYLPKSGGVLTGTVSSTAVTTPFSFSNPNGTIIAKLEAGTTAVTNTCTLQMASNSSSILEFRDNLALNVKAQLKYAYGSPGSLGMIVNGVTSLSASDTLCTFGVPLAMSSKKISGLLAGSATTTDAANVQQVEASVLVETNARIAADAVVTNNSVQKAGSALTGALTWSNVAVPISAVNTGGSLNLSLTAGTGVSTQPCSIKMGSNSQSYLEFTDVLGATKAWLRYLASGGGSIDLTVANIPMLTLTSTTVTLGGTVQLGGNRLTGLAATPTTDTDAVPRLYMVNANAAVVASSVQKSGSTMTGDLNLGGTRRVTNMAASSVNGDAVRREELYGVFLPLNGGTMLGGINMLSQNIDGIPDAVSTHQPVSWDQIRNNSIVPVAFRSGQMIQREYRCPSLSDTLTTSSFPGNSNGVLISTPMTVTAYNHVLVRGGFEIECTGSGSDTFRIRFDDGVETIYFKNVVAPTASFRERYTMYEYLFLPTTSGLRYLTARLYNDSTTGDTITINPNWMFAVEESQA